ncbi:putative ankyrin repeat protein RF_0381 [Nasonia vitripennis]|uniref:Uncharacterized protein n=1 Tax=Nasonia vitripennis TaxID=7425 RepID=A0A7M7GDI7_NASVI|nr:putative ankyrin repeat protein RF_0381 [Nasonia vitripennis]XP_031783634.1 putative ankyrin repeat protein RF_0381 [Nasonia vitripennis]
MKQASVANTKGRRKTIRRICKKRMHRSSRRYYTKLMFKALKSGNVPMVSQLFKDGGLLVNSRSLGMTNLHLAVKYDFIPEAIKLINLGADVRLKTPEGETALQFAVTNKRHSNILMQMIPNGFKYEFMRFYGLESLRFAVANRATSAIKDPADTSDALYRAQQRYSFVKLLLDAGAEVNTKDVNGCSPLHCAVYTGDLELVRILTRAGADINSQNNIGATALHDAVLCCDADMVFWFLCAGANFTARTLDLGNTALHWATMLNIDNSHECIIKMLLEFGSDLNVPNTYNWTPFNNVVRFCDINLLRFCIDEYKADLKRLNIDGNSALTFAVQNVNKNVTDVVLESGLDVLHKSDDNRTLLHFASELSMLDNVRYLISRGAEINAKDKNGITPFLLCTLKIHDIFRENWPLALARASYTMERKQVMRLLLELGSDLNLKVLEQKPQDTQSVFELVIVMEDTEALHMIIEYVAEVEAKTNKKQFDDYNLKLIDAQPEIKDYYQKCQDELKTMKTTKIEGTTITYYFVLKEPLDVVARYTRNKELVEQFKHNLHSLCPFYASQLDAKLNAAIARQKVIERGCSILSELIPFADSSCIAYEIIFKYLSEADVKLLIGSEFH